MRNVFSVLFLSVVACTPLEDRVEIFDPEWCTDIEDKNDPDYKGAPRRTTAEYIKDGDTFDTVAEEETPATWETIRLLGPDTPEKKGTEVRGVTLVEDRCYAQESTDFLIRALQGRLLRLEFDASCNDDPNPQRARRLAYVFITVEVDDPLRAEIEAFGDLIPESDEAEDVLVNEWVLRAGMSDMWFQFEEKNPDARYSDRLFEARAQARLAELGGWKDCVDDSNVFPNVE